MEAVRAAVYSYDDILMFNKFEMDGYVCQAVNPGDSSPADILSAFLETPVVIVMEGLVERVCFLTDAFHDLVASCTYPIRPSLILRRKIIHSRPTSGCLSYSLRHGRKPESLKRAVNPRCSAVSFPRCEIL